MISTRIILIQIRDFEFELEAENVDSAVFVVVWERRRPRWDGTTTGFAVELDFGRRAAAEAEMK